MNPNLDKNWNDIPSLTVKKFMYDGVPKIDFQELVLFPLNAGLGSISMNGCTLLATVRRTDAGGVFGVPPRAAAPANVVAESDARNERAAACILNYIDINCALYKLYMRSFNQNGIDIYNHLLVYGPIPTPQKILTARDDAWTQMSMDKLNMYYTANNYLKWIEIVTEQGRKMNPPKTGQQMKDKFIAGLPDSVFKDVKTIMSQDTRFVYPALYGGLPEFAVTSLAATPHPLAGQPNVNLLGRAYLPDWIGRIVSTQKGIHVPSGLVRSVLGPEYDVADGHANLTCDDCDGEAFLTAKEITNDTRCFVCNGLGHSATCTLNDGTKGVCLTKILGNKPEVKSASSADVGKSETDINALEKRLNRYRATSKAHQLENAELKQHILQLTTRKPFSRRESAHVATEEEEEEDATSASEFQDDAASDQSEFSEFDASTFANYTSPKARGKRPTPKRR